jgi:hypothetical protein
MTPPRPSANHHPCPLPQALRDASGQLYYGYDEWECLAADEKPWFDFLCANHARNLPMDELNRQFQTYITKELGESMKAIQMESGGRSRVEASGILFLRSLCRLTHTGHAQYAKGDGVAQHYANWEATLEPVHLDTLGELYVADEDVIVGPRGMRLTKSGSLLGYIVAQYIDGDEEDPVRTQCVDLYIEDALPKHLAYLHCQKKVNTLLLIISSVLAP